MSTLSDTLRAHLAPTHALRHVVKLARADASSEADAEDRAHAAACAEVYEAELARRAALLLPTLDAAAVAAWRDSLLGWYLAPSKDGALSVGNADLSYCYEVEIRDGWFPMTVRGEGLGSFPTIAAAAAAIRRHAGEEA